MRLKHALATVTMAIAAIGGGAIPLAGTAAADPPKTLQLVEHYTFDVSMTTFQKARTDKTDKDVLDWSSDGCSKSPDKPRGYNFLPSCQRHDFGYRNYKRQGAFNSSTKKSIDDNFHKDLYKYCDQFEGGSAWKGVECRRIADVYYEAVKKVGS
jgi:Prokaryotic phospholipase A2